jgi:hypothetical protein
MDVTSPNSFGAWGSFTLLRHGDTSFTNAVDANWRTVVTICSSIVERASLAKAVNLFETA